MRKADYIYRAIVKINIKLVNQAIRYKEYYVNS